MRLMRAMNFRPDLRTVVSAALIVFAFPPWNLDFLIWVALIPWFDALWNTTSRRDALVQGVWLSFFMSVGGFYWVAYVLNEFGGVPWPFAVVGMLLFALFNEIQFIVLAPVQRFIQREFMSSGYTALRAAALALFAGLLYSGADWCLPKLFADTLGHALYRSTNLRQLADIGGPPLLTVLVYTSNLALWTLYRRLRDRKEPSLLPTIRQTLPHGLLALLLIAAGMGYGIARNRQVQQAMSSPRAIAQIGVVQANVGDIEKMAAEKGLRQAANNVLDSLFRLSERALKQNPRLDAIVWPETSYPSTFRTPETAIELQRDQTVERFVREHGVPLLFGGYDQRGGKDFNALFFLSPTGALGENDLQTYRKNKLLLFGEYIPGYDSLPFLKSWFPQIGQFGHGVGPDVLSIPARADSPRTPLIPVGPIICYEALFPAYIIPAARRGSQMILNITNDSWFGPWGEPELHLALTTFRSIEVRLPQLRSTNTGISALILPDGSMPQQTEKGVATIMNTNIPLIAPMWTLMLAWGDWFGTFSLVFGLLAAAVTCQWPWVARMYQERLRRRTQAGTPVPVPAQAPVEPSND